MKILHVCYSDIEGGAARAAYRIHLAQQKIGINSHMLVVNKFSDDDSVHTVRGFSKFRIKVSGYLAQLILKAQKTTNPVHHSLNIFSSGLLKNINDISPDIVNLHWLGGEMLSIREIARIKQPIVWTMHDMWAFCGAEHYEDLGNEGRYRQSYSSRNRNFKHHGFDIDKYIYSKKKKFWKNQTFHIVTPSVWLSGCTKESALLGKHDTIVISNCIDHEVYRPVCKNISRDILGLPKNKKLLLFGAMSSTIDSRKGCNYLIEALQSLRQEEQAEDIELVIFGAGKGELEADTGLVTHYMGRLYDDVSLVLLYNAADIFVAPSIQDNLPNTIVESLACGTPCISFNVGGMPDLISDINGFLVGSVSSCELKNAIESNVLRSFASEAISRQCKGLRNENRIALEYMKLYLSIADHDL